MKKLFSWAFSLFLISFISNEALGQVYGTNTLELQLGNLPFEDDRYLTTSYNQLNLFYDTDKVSFFTKVEQFLTPHQNRNYLELSQKQFQFQDDHLRIRIGNFYETLGYGLLLRSYDIPGSVYENEFDRTRYTFLRDLEGVSVNASGDWFELKALRAEPLNNLIPPTFEPDSVRRPDLVEAIQGNFYATDQITVGGALMRVNTPFSGDFQEYGSVMSDIQLPFNVQLFGEYAFSTSSQFLSFTPQNSYALYSGLNFFKDSFGLSFEYKDYSNFRLGSSGFNDPPSLIKEHTYPVLNRSTHVVSTASETGIQLEVFYNFEDGHSIVANYTSATNNVFIRQKFYEYFLEGSYKVNETLSLKSFFDFAKDDPKLEDNRISVGFIVDKSFGKSQNIIVDLQYQTFDRQFEPDKTENFFGSLSYAFSSDLIISTVFEATTDILLTDNPNTFPEIEEATRTWLGFNSLYKINSSNSLAIFAGKRRGGPACTSGICYEILDFEGVELRLNTRF